MACKPRTFTIQMWNMSHAAPRVLHRSANCTNPAQVVAECGHGHAAQELGQQSKSTPVSLLLGIGLIVEEVVLYLPDLLQLLAVMVHHLPAQSFCKKVCWILICPDTENL